MKYVVDCYSFELFLAFGNKVDRNGLNERREIFIYIYNLYYHIVILYYYYYYIIIYFKF